MAVNVGTAYVNLRLREKQLSGDFKRARRKAGRETARMERDIKGKMAGVAAAVAAAGVVIAAGIKKATDAASALEETTSKFNVVFKGQTEIAEKWSKTLVDGYAMSTRESKAYLSSVQDLLVPMGMQADAAGKMSYEVTKLAADLGSFNNLPTAQVMGDIQSALVGNFETMKKYGVVLNATVVQEKAMAMGLAETKKQLTAADKAQAAYALMVGGSKAAIGDMARTQDSYANSVKKMHASFEDLAATLGNVLLPVMTALVQEVTAIIKALNEGKFMSRSMTTPKSSSGLSQKAYIAQLLGGQGMTDTYDLDYGQDAAAVATGGTGGGAGGGAGSPAAVAAQEEAKARLDAEAKFQEDRAELRAQAWQDDKAFKEQQLIDDLEQSNRKIAIEKETERQKQAVRKAMQKNAVQDLKYFLAWAGTQNKTAFQAYKAVAIAEATINTYIGATKALAQGGFYGILMAAAVVAAGMARVSQIASMQPGSGGSTGGGGATGTYQADPTSGQPSNYGSFGSDEKKGSLNINISGDVLGPELIDRIVERINEAGDRDVYVNESRYAGALS